MKKLSVGMLVFLVLIVALVNGSKDADVSRAPADNIAAQQTALSTFPPEPEAPATEESALAALASVEEATERTAVPSAAPTMAHTVLPTIRPAPTAQPTPQPSPTPTYVALSQGDKGDGVLFLQERLVELGYQIGVPDGQYGNKTDAAIKAVQVLAGLSVTGVADEETQTAIWSEAAPTAQPRPTVKPTPKPEPEEDDYDVSVGSDYILNKNTKVFHDPWCSSVDQMKEKNKVPYSGSRDGAIRKGYRPCKRCDP